MLYGVFLKHKYLLFNFNQNSIHDTVYIILNTLYLLLYSSSGIRAIDSHLQYIEKPSTILKIYNFPQSSWKVI